MLGLQTQLDADCSSAEKHFMEAGFTPTAAPKKDRVGSRRIICSEHQNTVLRCQQERGGGSQMRGQEMDSGSRVTLGE